MSDKLKPCPFCGELEDLQWQEGDDESNYTGGYVWVNCPVCDCNGPKGETQRETVELWNRRAEVKGDGTAL